MLLLLVALVANAETLASDDARVDGVARVVAIADIHGAYDAMVATLQNADILGDHLSWVGGTSHLVIVGDILDRGPKSRAAMDLLMRLEGEAAAAGGRVHVLIGNHESMLLTGDMRYVSAPEYAAFASDEDPAERERWFELYVEREGGDAAKLRQKFDGKFPLGYFAMRRAFRADGRYGAWLLQKNIIAVINETAFVHGGLSPLVAEVGLDGINKDLHLQMVRYVEVLGTLTDAEVLLPTDSHYDYKDLLTAYLPNLRESQNVLRAIDEGIRLDDMGITSTDGPLWYRNNILCPGIVEEHRLDAALAAIGAKRVVVGHTPTPSRQVTQRFDGRVIEIDTGMLNFYYQGVGHALVLEGDSLSITNQSGVTSKTPLTQSRNVGRRPDHMTTLALKALLERGDILSVEKISAGALSRTMVQVSDGKHTINAVFNKPKGRGFYPSVAAYRLDEMLNLEMVPVTVLREVDGKRGSLQFMPENITDEASRSAAGQGGSAWCSITDQWPAMYVFDVLVFNQGRTQQRILYDRSNWRLILSEHDRAFAAKKGKPPHLRNTGVALNAGWVSALSQLSDEMLAEKLNDVLDKKRLRSLLVRRDQLLTGE